MTDETTTSSEHNDDIEAHAARGSAPAQPAEVEAHTLRIIKRAEHDADVEAHGMTSKHGAAQPAEVEAHTMRGKASPAQPAEVEAHGFSARGRGEGVETPEAATERESTQDDAPDVEGHMGRGKG